MRGLLPMVILYGSLHDLLQMAILTGLLQLVLLRGLLQMVVLHGLLHKWLMHGLLQMVIVHGNDFLTTRSMLHSAIAIACSSVVQNSDSQVDG